VALGTRSRSRGTGVGALAGRTGLKRRRTTPMRISRSDGLCAMVEAADASSLPPHVRESRQPSGNDGRRSRQRRARGTKGKRGHASGVPFCSLLIYYLRRLSIASDAGIVLGQFQARFVMPAPALMPATYQQPADTAPAKQVLSQDNSLGDAARKSKQ
jgi:hypothetical protein